MSPWVSLITVLALLFFLVVTINVGGARVKYGVKAPAVSGSPEFERVLRVQQNTLEQLILFLPALWIFANFVSAIPAAILGAIWIGSRILYAWGYYKAAERRGPGFAIGILCIIVLLMGSLMGIGLYLWRS